MVEEEFTEEKMFEQIDSLFSKIMERISMGQDQRFKIAASHKVEDRLVTSHRVEIEFYISTEGMFTYVELKRTNEMASYMKLMHKTADFLSDLVDNAQKVKLQKDMNIHAKMLHIIMHSLMINGTIVEL